MPRYDYLCTTCGLTTESIQHHSVRIITCPRCMNEIAERQLSAPGGIRANGKDGGMVLSEKQMKMIKEPVWQDEKTGAVTSV